MKKLSIGGVVQVRGEQVTVERSIGGGDYIVRRENGERYAVNIRTIESVPSHQPQFPGAVIKDSSSAPPIAEAE